MAMTTTQTSTLLLARPEGRIGYDVTGDGPLVVCLPGMGELRSSYRFTVPALAAGGFRVATMDLRGHGDSDATFTRVRRRRCRTGRAGAGRASRWPRGPGRQLHGRRRGGVGRGRASRPGGRAGADRAVRP